ncbi:integrase arm-type DNA-binding domain-containing protein [Methylobacterium sp. B1]|uniref:tyrosine-type recombinase/integrase n=1 Tax=Methylobacterium sp. B1 TaxID=91459 RepID=UPI00034B6703|nr:integrase arm-type DNA-binding domain-containing protein [Methylobacterium sp. B1]
MAREINRLSARKVQTLNEPGRHADGGGLHLVIEPSGSKRWVMLYRMPGRRREMGLGSASAITLARARELAAAARAQIAEGIDPIDAKAAAVALPSPPAPVTFADVAETYMADREKCWRNAAHRAQWRQTLEVQAASLWRMPVAEIGTDDVLAVLRPMWHEKAETARRIRGRIERVLDAARVGGHRSGETRGLTWGEVDMAAALWTLPAERMKAGRLHRVKARTVTSSCAICASSRCSRFTHSRRAGGTLGCHEAKSHHARPVQAICQRICGR